MSLQAYRDYIASKASSIAPSGFQPAEINANAKTHQRAALGFDKDAMTYRRRD